MARSTRDGGGSSPGIDMSQFYQVFFDEAGENLESMERMLLELDLESTNDEDLNAIFRCAHSVKGGAATFGFADVAELTHEMETLLDKIRRHELDITAAMVDVLLAGGDALKAQLLRHQGGDGVVEDTSELLQSIRVLVNSKAPRRGARSTAQKKQRTEKPVQAAASGRAVVVPRTLDLRLGTLEDVSVADSVVGLFKEIVNLGSIEELAAGKGADGMRRFKVVTTMSDSDLIDLLGFHVAREQVQLSPLTDDEGSEKSKPAAPATAEEKDIGYGLFDDAPGAPTSGSAGQPQEGALDAVSPQRDARQSVSKVGGKAAAAPESSTLRVSVEKVDQLINLVGELVITQAMLEQNSKDLDRTLDQGLKTGLSDLKRNTRELQEAVLSIRMIPMSLVFNRFPRMLRDLAGRLGKKVDLVQVGEATELDKGLVEKITDPLTHLVRNSCDHGIEPPAERVARGKPEHGTIMLVASHQGGSIVIEVRDDGKGLNRGKLLKKARERGLDVSDAMSDGEVYNLIFAPGFSTADEVTDVSGRGVGMDVVKKNINALGGTVEIESTEGQGMTVRVRLPLTLAIMDGMGVRVSEEVYILPLSTIVESFQVGTGTVRTIGGSGRVVRVRDEYMPVISLATVFNVPTTEDTDSNEIMVVVEDEVRRVALLVDELLGQQQVVVKNLESNYRKVDAVSGASILGDGRVALILDVAAVARSAH